MNLVRKTAIAGALLGTAVAGGAVGATMLTPASAQTSTTTAPAATDPATPAVRAAPSGPHQANGKTEALLTGDDLAKVTAAVQTEVPGATIDRAETDADGDVYEAHITKADGTKATVKFDANFTVTSVDAGMR